MESNSLLRISGVGKNSLAGPISTLGDDTKNVEPYTNNPEPQLLIMLFAITPLVVTETSTKSV